MSHIYKKLSTDQITQLEAQAGNEAAKLIDDLLDKSVDPDLIQSAVNDWLEDHPEATTTVEDGSITKAKLATPLQNAVDSIPAVDATLETSGAAADAKKTGDEISDLKSKGSAQGNPVIVKDVPAQKPITLEADGATKIYTSGRNLLRLPYFFASNVPSSLIEGITWTMESDKSISVSGTATALSQIYLVSAAAKVKVPSGRLNANLVGGHGNANFFGILMLYKGAATSYTEYRDYGSGVEIPVPNDDDYYIACLVRCANGYAVPNGTSLKPQIVFGSDVSTYELPSYTEYAIADIHNIQLRDGYNLLWTDYNKSISVSYVVNIKDYVDTRTTFDYINYRQKIMVSTTTVGLPILYLSGETGAMSKDVAVTLDYNYGGRQGTLTCKWQGSSSLQYPKKNYKVTFDNAFEVFAGWGNQKKYVLKANYIDYSQARNVVAAKLWGKCVKSRATQNPYLHNLVNGGAIDGFPIMLVINGEYQGLYTWTIPKEPWLFGMGNGEHECIMSAEILCDATTFKSNTTAEEILAGTTFGIEYITDESETSWATTSLINMIDAVINATSIADIENYIDVDSVIDTYCFNALLGAYDCIGRNYLLVTYDGTKWYMSAYDLDSTFGNYVLGTSYYSASSGRPTVAGYPDESRLMQVIATYAKSALKARFTSLLLNAMAEQYINFTFSNYIANIPKALYDEEVKIWPGTPGTQTNNLSQINTWYGHRVKDMATQMNNL